MEKIIDKIKFPETWKPCKISKLGKVFKGKGISKAEILDSGLACIRYGEIYSKYDYKVDGTHSFINKDSANKSQEIKYGDILFTGSGETAEEIGKAVAYIGREQAYAGGDIIILRPNEPDSGLFYGYLMNSDYVVQQKFQEAQGQSVVHLYGKSMDRIKVILPPLPEQQKIATILSKWDELIETQTQLIEEKEKQKKGLMQKLLTGEVRFPGFEEEWEEVRLGEVAEVKRGAGSQYITYVDKENLQSIRLIRISDFLGDDPKYILRTEHTDRFLLNEGDLLIAGTGATAGITFEVPEFYSNTVFSYNAPRIRVGKGILKKYLIQFLKSNIILRQQLALFTGNAQPFLDIAAIEGFKIKTPTFQEQEKIASVLSFIDEEIQLLKDKLEAIKLQKKGLMQQLLTGKIRVKV